MSERNPLLNLQEAVLQEALTYFARVNDPKTQPDPWSQEHRDLVRESMIISRMNVDLNGRVARALERIADSLEAK